MGQGTVKKARQTPSAAALRAIAKAALRQFGQLIPGVHIKFIAHNENATFKVTHRSASIDAGSGVRRRDETAGVSMLLRIHYPNQEFRSPIWQRYEVIQSELVWLEALQSDTMLVTPRPLRTPDGSSIVQMEARFCDEPVNCTLLHWLPGRHLGRRTGRHAHGMGTMVGRLHQHSRKWHPPEGFIRPNYDWDRLAGPLEPLHEAVKQGKVTHDQYEELARAMQKTHELLQCLPRNRETWGLIHADLHENNYLFDNGSPRPIDFSCCGFGYYLYDVGYALRQFAPTVRQPFISGYTESIDLPEGWCELVEGFAIAGWIGNLAFRHATPARDETFKQTVRQVMSTCVSPYLAGQTWLFGP